MLEVIQCKLSKEYSAAAQQTIVKASIDVVDEDIVNVKVHIIKDDCNEFYLVDQIIVGGEGNDWGSPVRTMKAASFAVEWFQKTFEDEYKVIPD
jgi:hypothetical protein